MSTKLPLKKPEGKAFQKLKNQYDATEFFVLPGISG
jgi:hypothetical protein